ncbi:MAG: haloacid dehalogenase-like protein hydrolase [Microgenomates group bacterium GW2011_GWA2_46_7]|nr:MAG: haloacid dehalogenase-like protein hydrolase [Microgenomates group bacterium GW2011_GWA2_46_7]KKU46733.1 MAG: haloacid dehalogenase-like protein hydrolase [Microgenomates group bacterium GW2011_GWC2_46_7]
MFTKYKLFIFDFDGTLCDSRINIANSLNDALQIAHYPKIDNTRIYPLIGKINIEETFLTFYPNLTAEQVTQMVSDFQVYQFAHVADEIKFFPQVPETLLALKSRGKTLCVLTAKGTTQIVAILKKLKIAQLFSTIYGREPGHADKPSSDTISAILSGLPDEYASPVVVMVGDTTIDCETAKNTHVDMIGVSYGIDTPEVLQRSGATYIINTFDELLR